MNTRTSKSFAIWTVVLALVVASAALALTGCGTEADQNGSATTDGSTPAPPAGETTVTDAQGAAMEAATLVLTEADNGKSFTLSVGDTIAIVLEGNPTTGYAWESAMPEEAAPLMTLVGEPLFQQSTVGTNVVGAGGTYTFTFAAAATGQVELKLKYWRSFEAQAEPLQTFAVNLTVK